MASAQVLIVEDERIVARDLQNMLEQLGYAAVTASTGEQAIKKAATSRPDIVLMNVRLKGPMDGIQAAEEIRSRFDIPVIYLTADINEDLAVRDKITGQSGYILKPLNENELQLCIELALYRHRRSGNRKARAAD